MESIWHSLLVADPSLAAVIEKGANVPGAVPGVRLDRGANRIGSITITFCPGLVLPHGRNLGKAAKAIGQEPGQPDALPPSLDSHTVHPVVPVTAPHQG